MAEFAARYGHLVLVKWLCGEGGFAVDKLVVRGAAGSGNLEVVQWLLREGGGLLEGRCILRSCVVDGKWRVVKLLIGTHCGH